MTDLLNRFQFGKVTKNDGSAFESVWKQRVETGGVFWIPPGHIAASRTRNNHTESHGVLIRCLCFPKCPAECGIAENLRVLAAALPDAAEHSHDGVTKRLITEAIG